MDGVWKHWVTDLLVRIWVVSAEPQPHYIKVDGLRLRLAGSFKLEKKKTLTFTTLLVKSVEFEI